MAFNLKSAPVISALFILAFIGLRLFSGGGNFSYFIVAGSDFNPDPRNDIVVQEGPGYDGQFFYRYAMDPSAKEDCGILVDHPAYRHQRILYPLLVFLFSFGFSSMVPFMMVFINALCIFLTCFTLDRYLKNRGGDRRWALFPLFLSGLWMSLGRDLAECMEALLLVSFFLSLISKRLVPASLLAIACLFTRESSILLVGPALLYFLVRDWKETTSRKSFHTLLSAGLPILLFSLWRIYLYDFHRSESFVEGSNNIGWPLLGIFHGLMQSLKKVHDLKDVFELILWTLHFVWNAYLVVLVLKHIRSEIPVYLKWAWISGLGFALLFSVSIYNDDWSFARVLTGFNILSALILIERKAMPSMYFLLYTFALTASTLIRLWLRP